MAGITETPSLKQTYFASGGELCPENLAILYDELTADSEAFGDAPRHAPSIHDSIFAGEVAIQLALAHSDAAQTWLARAHDNFLQGVHRGMVAGDDHHAFTPDLNAHANLARTFLLRADIPYWEAVAHGRPASANFVAKLEDYAGIYHAVDAEAWGVEDKMAEALVGLILESQGKGVALLGHYRDDHPVATGSSPIVNSEGFVCYPNPSWDTRVSPDGDPEDLRYASRRVQVTRGRFGDKGRGRNGSTNLAVCYRAAGVLPFSLRTFGLRNVREVIVSLLVHEKQDPSLAGVYGLRQDQIMEGTDLHRRLGRAANYLLNEPIRPINEEETELAAVNY